MKTKNIVSQNALCALLTLLNLSTADIHAQGNTLIVNGVLYPNGIPEQTAPPAAVPTGSSEMAILNGVLYPTGLPGTTGSGSAPPVVATTPPTSGGTTVTSPANTTGAQFLVATTPATVGQNITVSWVTASTSPFTDSILMVRRDGTSAVLTAQKFVAPPSGSTNFLAESAGTYDFRYIRANGELILISNPVIIGPGSEVLRVRALHSPQGITLSWNAKSNTTYRVLSSIDPARPTFEWQTEADVRATQAGELQFTPPLSRIPRRFFLIRQSPSQ